jgi:uncharacterized protein (DUF433 family)
MYSRPTHSCHRCSELLGAGATLGEILKDYPFLEREDILAALDYAAYQTDHVVLQTS